MVKGRDWTSKNKYAVEEYGGFEKRSVIVTDK
jgi:hypothetical protein